MKKFLIFTFSLIILIGIFTVSSYASEQNQVLDEELASILKSQLSSDEYALLGNRELYDDNLSSFYLSDQSIIKLYRTHIYWEFWYLELNDIIKYAEEDAHREYVIFGEQDIRINVFEKNNIITLYKLTENASSVNYVADIKKAKSNMVIFDKACKVNAIYCFDDIPSHGGALVYYCTDNGTFAKYYEDQYSQGVWFTEDDLEKYGKSYYEYISSYEYNYDANGDVKNGGTSFLSFVNDVYPNQSKRNTIKPFLLIIPCVLLGSGVGAYFIIRASKKRKINKQA